VQGLGFDLKQKGEKEGEKEERGTEREGRREREREGRTSSDDFTLMVDLVSKEA
jgi:hypothetical protein